jgi:hypothetical protein
MFTNKKFKQAIRKPLVKIFGSAETLEILYNYDNKNNKSVNSCTTCSNVYNMDSNIKDRKIVLPNQIQPMELHKPKLNQYLYEHPLDNYTVQSGLKDNNESPEPQVFKPLGVAIQNYIDLEKDKKPKYIHEIYDGILNDRPIGNKEKKDDQYNIIAGHKGYTLNVDNWNYYKDEEFANGGYYNKLIGIENNKSDKMRIVDGYNDFELKEWI